MILVKIFYVIAIFLIPYTQHPLYLTHVKKYFFGFFAIAGPLFNLFGLLSTISVALSIYLLIKNLKEEKVSIKKTRVKYILLSFGLAAFVNHFDVVIMKGYKIYPIGNFVFIPMSLLGYAIYKHDVMEWKIFLNRGIVFFTLLLMAIGTFIGLAVLLKSFFFETISVDLIYLLSRGMLKNIFKPFFTTKPQGKGIGLGLYIVHEIIKDHNDSIEAMSGKGKGTTFTITLPCHQQ